MRKKRIVFSQYDDIKNPHYAGGGAYAVHEIAKRSAKNYKVTVVTGNYPNALTGISDGIKYMRLGPSFLGPKLGQLIYHILLPFAVKRTKHDIWLESFTPPFSTSFTPLFTDKPVVGLVHMLSGYDMRRKYRLPFDWVEKIGIKKYQNFIVMNKADREKILKINPGAKVEIIGNGLNLPRRVSKVDSQHILYLGRIEVDQKGLDLLIKAYSAYKNKIKLPLLIAGSGQGEELKHLNNLLDKNNIKKKVILTGRVSGKKKADLFKKAVFVVIPSRYETFSIVALEALSYGVPLLTFDLDGLSWIPKKCRLTADNENWKKFGRLIYRLYSDKSLRDRMSLSAKKASKNYSWDKKYKEYQKFIDEVINS